jgi:hypothetical protein
MMSRRILRTSLAVLLCLAAIPIFVGCGDKTTAPVATPSGACCNVSGGCSITTQASCGGTWQGANTACAPNPCASMTSGQISGIVTLAPGMSGDLGNSRVAVYSSYDDWNHDRVMRQQAVQGSGASISFVITNLPGGTYYLDVWKDIDNDGLFDFGDFYGVNGTIQWPTVTPAPIAVVVGQTSSASVLIYSVPNN